MNPRAVPRGLAMLLALALAPAASSAQRTYANPVDLDYRYNWEQANEGISYRTGADPAIVRHKGAYYLFATVANGYWRSTDLLRWRFIKPSRWPAQGVVAPAAWTDGRQLYLMPATMAPEAVLVSKDPARGRLRFLTRRTPELPGAVRPGLEGAIRPGQIPPGPWDPALFRDQQRGWFLYWGSSNVFPIYGTNIELGARFRYGRPRPLIALDPANHGWERFGRDHDGLDKAGRAVKPFVEGPWMTKHAGHYYLQYAAPGTEFNVYATGVYTARAPLGPFVYAPYNPVGYKPGGYVQGAGHGSTFQDAYGNWWNAGTAWIGANWPFERRIALFPARFYPDGQMAISTRFGDLPHYVPHGRERDPDRLFTGWMLLSYRARATASSTLGTFVPGRVTDENPRTFWVAEHNRPGETLTLDLGGVMTIRATQINFADYRAGRFTDAPDIYTTFDLRVSRDGRTWKLLSRSGRERRDRANAYLELPRPVRARYVQYLHGHVGAAHLAISDLRVFGRADGRMPPAPMHMSASRDCDQREAYIAWAPVAGAVGYNVRWGVRPDRLTLAYQVFADQLDRDRPRLILRALDVGQSYAVAVESFNKTGVSQLSPLRRLPTAAIDSRFACKPMSPAAAIKASKAPHTALRRWGSSFAKASRSDRGRAIREGRRA